MKTPICVLVILLGVMGLWRTAFAQQDDSTPDETAVSDVVTSDDEADAAVSAVAPPPKPLPEVKDAEAKEEPGVLKQIDKGFAKAVDVMLAVLFYRVGAETEEYVVFTGHEVYLRG